MIYKLSLSQNTHTNKIERKKERIIIGDVGGKFASWKIESSLIPMIIVFVAAAVSFELSIFRHKTHWSYVNNVSAQLMEMPNMNFDVTSFRFHILLNYF